MAQETSWGAGASFCFLWVQKMTVGIWELCAGSLSATLAAKIQ